MLLPFFFASPASATINLLSMLRYFTAGESHGESLVASLSGMPAGVAIVQSFLDRELWRRREGFGRGGGVMFGEDTTPIGSRWPPEKRTESTLAAHR